MNSKTKKIFKIEELNQNLSLTGLGTPAVKHWDSIGKGRGHNSYSSVTSYNSCFVIANHKTITKKCIFLLEKSL